MRLQCILLCQVFIILVMTTGCSSLPSESNHSPNKVISSSLETGVNQVPPTEEELIKMLEQKQHQVLWCVGEFDCYSNGNIATWNTEVIDYNALWESISNTIFEDVRVLDTEIIPDCTRLILSNGIRCEIFDNSLYLIVPDEINFPEAMRELEEAEEKLLDAVSSFFNMELGLIEDTETGRIYSFILSKTPINRSGYGYQHGGYVPGGYIHIRKEADETSAIEIVLGAVPKEEENTCSTDELIDKEKIIQICTANLMGSYPDKSIIQVIEDVKLTYALEPYKNQFVPMLQVVGYCFDGKIWAANRIINAVTGEIFWN